MKARSCVADRGNTGPLCEAHAARERRSQRRRRVSRPSATSEQLDGVAWGLPPLRPRCGAHARPGALAGYPLRGSKRLQPAISARGQALSHRRTSCRLLGKLLGESSSGARNRLTKPYFGPESAEIAPRRSPVRVRLAPLETAGNRRFFFEERLSRSRRSVPQMDSGAPRCTGTFADNGRRGALVHIGLLGECGVDAHVQCAIP
jgi:hypothetical protein